MKICTSCRIEKPLSQFTKCIVNKDGLHYVCRDCRCKQKREKRRQLRANPVAVPEFKLCPKCKITKSGGEFSRDPGSHSGIGGWCRVCVNQSREHQRRTDPVSYKMKIMLSGARGRAKEEGVPFDLTLEWLLESFGSVTHCEVLGIELYWNKGILTQNSPSLDKLIPERGYVPGNVRLISHMANQMKSNASEAELLRFCHYHLDRLEKFSGICPYPYARSKSSASLMALFTAT